jgi:hypothetical protein
MIKILILKMYLINKKIFEMLKLIFTYVIL